MFKFDQKRVNFKKKLGKGSFGAVYAYQKNLNDPEDDKWVVKNIVTRETKDVINQIQEVVLGFSCQNPYVLPVKGYYLDYNEDSGIWNVFIKLPRMAQSLRSIVEKHKKDQRPIPEDQIVKYMYAITKGLQYLHGRGIAHRDIKPDNILLDNEENMVRIADMGIGHYYGGQTTYDPAQQAGSLFYAAPENLDNDRQLIDKAVSKTDLWSLGMVILELCTLMDLGGLGHHKKGVEKEAEIKSYIQRIEGQYSKTLLELIIKLLRFEPDERISLLEVEDILNRNYQESSELKKVKIAAEDRNAELEPQAQKRIEELEKELDERVREIMILKEEQKRMIAEFEEFEKKRKRELEELLESKAKIEREYQKVLLVGPNESQEKAEDNEKEDPSAFLKDLVEKWKDEISLKMVENKKITIGIKNKKIASERMISIIAEILERCKQSNVMLKDLELDLNGCGEIIDQGLKELAMQIGQRLVNLQHPSLNFERCEKITDQGLKELVAQGIEGLLRYIGAKIEAAFSSIAKKEWVKLMEVGDTSDYVKGLAAELNEHVKVVKKTITGAYFAFYLTKLVDMIQNNFLENLYRTKKLTDIAIQRLQLDAFELKTVLGNLMKADLEGRRNLSIGALVTYAEYVNKKMAKVENILKLLAMSNEQFMSNLNNFFDDPNAPEIEKLMILKGLHSPTLFKNILNFIGNR